MNKATNQSEKADAPAEVRKTETAFFTRFTLDLPIEAVNKCSHQGECDDDVAYWATKIERPPEITPEALRLELKEYGAWDPEELSNDDANWNRLIWIAAGNIKEEMRNE